MCTAAPRVLLSCSEFEGFASRVHALFAPLLGSPRTSPHPPSRQVPRKTYNS